MTGSRYITILILVLFCDHHSVAQGSFVRTSKGQFILQGKPYYYIGANYWYASLLGSNKKGQERLKKELDFLVSKGVTNLRVLAGGEGEGLIDGVKRVEPPLQPGKGEFNDDVLKSLDYLLVEMGKRKMKAILFLSNNWEWSGGFLQYLNWNGLIADSTLRKKIDWDDKRDYVSKFYSCESCIKDYYSQVKHIITRKNSLTGKKYTDDPAIMAWELANEPRPMRPAASKDYSSWISQAAALIKSLDKNHLVTTGAEGEMGSESMDLFKEIHADKNIDYATIHIWPKNWSWFSDTAIAKSMSTVTGNTNNYIVKHREAVKTLNKPLVIEEFGLPRNNHSYSLSSPTSLRDEYYTGIFSTLYKSAKEGDIIAGANFWALGGAGRPAQTWWNKGDDWLGDPPMEEQGLNSVFDTDASTWKVIYLFTQKIKKVDVQKK
jgi:mannan endo-1,4-beta-mannosidase